MDSASRLIDGVIFEIADPTCRLNHHSNTKFFQQLSGKRVQRVLI